MALTAKAWARRNRASSNVAEIISPLARCIDCVCQWNWKTFFVSTKWPAITPVTVTTRSNFALAEPVDRHLDCLMELESFCCPKAVGPTAPGPTNCPKSGVCRSGWGRWTDAGRTWQMASTRTLGCRRGAVSSSQTTRSRSRSALAATALAGAAHAAGAAVVSSKGGGNTARFLNAGGTSHWPMHFGLAISKWRNREINHQTKLLANTAPSSCKKKCAGRIARAILSFSLLRSGPKRVRISYNKP